MDLISRLPAFGGLAALTGLVWAIIAYMHNQWTTRALERTKFVFEQSKFLDNDPSMQRANKILYGLSPNFTVETFLRVMPSKSGSSDEISLSMDFENYLNFLSRIAYAHLTLKTLKTRDVDVFGYYFYSMSRHKELCEYCVKEGFEDIIEVAQKLVSIWRKSEIRTASYRHQNPDVQ